MAIGRIGTETITTGAAAMSTGEPGVPQNGLLWVDTDSDVPTLNPADYVQNTAVGTTVAPVSNPTFSGVASFPDGSASAPSITNTGDTNTGIAFPADDTVAIATGGSERLRVDSAGRVGLGAASPAERLHLRADGAAHARLERFSTNETPQNITFVKARGTGASPSVVAQNDYLGNIFFAGYDGSANLNAAWITAQVDGTPGANDMPTRLLFFTTPDGSATLTERMRIDNAGLITGTGTSLGAWTAYTPTVGGTGWAIGNGTASGLYCQIGKFVHFRVRIIFGNTSTFGAGNVTISLPLTARTSDYHMTGRFQDSSAGLTYATIPQQSSTTVVQMWTLGASGVTTTTTSTVPFTWADTDNIFLSGSYEIA